MLTIKRVVKPSVSAVVTEESSPRIIIIGFGSLFMYSVAEILDLRVLIVNEYYRRVGHVGGQKRVSAASQLWGLRKEQDRSRKKNTETANS